VRRIAPLALALCAAAVLPGCPSSNECTPEGEKQLVLGLAKGWYLFPDLLAPVNPRDYADSESLLRALVAPAVEAGKDRGWSFLTTPAEQQQYFGEGKTVGFGIWTLWRSSRLFVSQVAADSAAAMAGFRRGDEIVELGESEPLAPVSSLLAPGTLSQALGPSEAGVTRSFRVVPVANKATTELRTMTKSEFSIDAVPRVGIVPAGTAGLGRDVGVVVLRSFVSTADAALTAAIEGFRASQVTDVVVDVRYNGGGLVSTAERLANLLGAGLSDQTMYDLVHNPAHATRNEHHLFAPLSQSIRPLRVAFVTTRASASASELVPNVLEPYLTPPHASSTAVALVGNTTYGKPVGQLGFDLSSCGKVLYLVSVQILNAEGEGGYYSGLPDSAVPPAFGGPLCPATDDLDHEMGSEVEDSTAAALYWLANGSCRPVQAPLAAARALSVAARDEYPAPERPTLAQVENPGLF
jgi:carboxyl-terminal processing protease